MSRLGEDGCSYSGKYLEKAMRQERKKVTSPIKISDVKYGRHNKTRDLGYLEAFAKARRGEPYEREARMWGALGSEAVLAASL
jgi:hypothetical protein